MKVLLLCKKKKKGGRGCGRLRRNSTDSGKHLLSHNISNAEIKTLKIKRLKKQKKGVEEQAVTPKGQKGINGILEIICFLV